MVRRIKEGNEKERDRSSQSGTHRNSQSWIETGEGRDKGHLVEKKESPKEERVVKPVISLSGKIGY